MCVYIFIYSSSGYKSQATFGRHAAARQQDCMANVFIIIFLFYLKFTLFFYYNIMFLDTIWRKSNRKPNE